MSEGTLISVLVAPNINWRDDEECYAFPEVKFKGVRVTVTKTSPGYVNFALNGIGAVPVLAVVPLPETVVDKMIVSLQWREACFSIRINSELCISTFPKSSEPEDDGCQGTSTEDDQ